MTFPDRIRLPLRFDATRLMDDLAIAEATGWTDHFVTRNYHGQWSAIALRAPVGETHPIRMIYSNPAAKAYCDTPLLAGTPYFRVVLATLRCPLLSVRLMRLAPDSHIKPHRDHDLDADAGTARLHIPIITSEDVNFRLNGTRVCMMAGECWYLRLSDEHSVRNDGAIPRVHIVIDTAVDAWLISLLEKGAAEHAIGSWQTEGR